MTFKNRFYPRCVKTALRVLGLCAFGICSGWALAHVAIAQETSLTNERSAQQKVFNASEFMLDNGMQVIVVPNHRVPVVTHMVWYKVGSAHEPDGTSGIAHFLEHLLFKGSEGLAPGEFSKTVRAIGGNDNAFTSFDYTAYFQSIASEHLETVMKMESGRMLGLAAPESEVISERSVILEERSQRTDNDPAGQFSEYLRAAMFVNHPYGTPILGWRSEMEELSHKDAYDFYNAHYAPNNAILIVSGDVQPERVLELAEIHYGRHKRVEIPVHTFTAIPPLDGVARITHSHPDIRQPQYQMMAFAPSYNSNAKDSLALQVLQEIMSGGPSSRLYKSLVIDQKIAVSAGLDYQANSLDQSLISLYASPAPDISLQTIETQIDAEIKNVITNGVTEDELTRAISRMQNAAIFALDSVAGPAMTIGRMVVTGTDLNDIETWPSQLETVTAQHIKDVAKTYLDPNNRELRQVRGFLEVEAQAKPEIQTENTPDSEAATAQDTELQNTDGKTQ
jgi:zinc protease